MLPQELGVDLILLKKELCWASVFEIFLNMACKIKLETYNWTDERIAGTED